MRNPTPDLPDPAALNVHQRTGNACARCAHRLYQSIALGTTTGADGRDVELWACITCATPQERAAHIAAHRTVTTGWCAVCHRWASNAIMVTKSIGDDVVTGYVGYAHPRCAEAAGLAPLLRPQPAQDGPGGPPAGRM